MTAGTRSPGADERLPEIGAPSGRWESRLFGGLVLAAFGLYGIGSAIADRPIGLLLVAANSVAVAVVGAIGRRLLHDHNPRAGAVYLGTRLAEAVLLAGGVFIHELAELQDADNIGYLLAMIALGAGSLPFWRAVGRGPWLPKRFAVWGIIGYFCLASGALLELTTGRGVTVIAAIPGGLFELALGVFLLVRGFGTTADGDMRPQ